MEEIKHIFKITLYEVFLKPSDNVTKIKMLQQKLGLIFVYIHIHLKKIVQTLIKLFRKD